ncbi:MAG: site-specific integrase [Rhizomicrobium sp.]
MSDSLFDAYGARKYIVPREREAFVRTALQAETDFAAFCLTLAITGARISEVLALGCSGVDAGDEGIVFQTLKQRGKKRFRLVPAPAFLLRRLIALGANQSGDRLWAFQRTHAWSRVKAIMRTAGIGEQQCKPKALRHGFAVDAVLNGVPLNILQRWMGHARIETTAIYAAVLGEEERTLARRVWRSIEVAVTPPSSD